MKAISYSLTPKPDLLELIFGFVQQFGVEIVMADIAVRIILWAAGVLGLFSGVNHIKKGSFKPNYK